MQHMMRRLAPIAVFFLIVGVRPVAAEQFPNGKPIEMTVMFGAGSAADVTARRLADGMSKYLGASVPVVNRTGGGGAVGYTYVAKQQPDGYHLIWESTSISTSYYSGILRFDYTAFDPVAQVSIELPVLAVRADSPWKTLHDFVTYAKANPEKVRIGNSGTGSHTQLAAAALFAAAGVSFVEVPYGAGQAVGNVLENRIEATVQLPAAVVTHLEKGELRVLAVLGSRREPVFPHVPTAQELGYAVALDMWRGVAVPKGTPRPIIATLERAIKNTVDLPEFRKAGRKMGFMPAFLPADDFGRLIASDDKKLAKVMQELGLKKL